MDVKKRNEEEEERREKAKMEGRAGCFMKELEA
jgi:hypothetical protein